MQKVTVKATINAGAKEVWKWVSNFSALDKYVEAISDCTIEGSGIGAVRTLTLQDGGKVKERLEEIDHEKTTLKYSMLDSPMPVANYTGTMQVRELGNNKSEFTWSSEFEVTQGSEKEIKEAMEGLYSLGVDGLNKLVS